MELGDLACWLDAGPGAEQWDAILCDVRARLEASAVAFGLASHGVARGEVFANRGADADFVGFCLQHLDRYGADEVQSAIRDDGVVYWSHATSDPRVAAQDVVVFARLQSPGKAKLLPELAREIARLAAARRARAEMRSAFALYGAVFDRLTFGVVAVDEALYAHEPNAVCRGIFARRDGLTLWMGKLHCRSERDRAELAGAVARTLAGENCAERILIGRARGVMPYVVHPVLSAAQEPSARVCLLAMVDPEIVQPPDVIATANASRGDAYLRLLERAIMQR